MGEPLDVRAIYIDWTVKNVPLLHISLRSCGDVTRSGTGADYRYSRQYMSGRPKENLFEKALPLISPVFGFLGRNIDQNIPRHEAFSLDISLQLKSGRQVKSFWHYGAGAILPQEIVDLVLTCAELTDRWYAARLHIS